MFGAFSPDEVLALVDGEAVVFRPRRLILATGAYERPMPMPGWGLPGVMTTGALQTLTRSQQVVPGRRVVIAGNGPLNFQLAADLVDASVSRSSPSSRAVPGRAWPICRRSHESHRLRRRRA